MGAPYPEEAENPARQPDGPQDPNRGRTIRGECHDAVTGELYAVDISIVGESADSIASFTHGISGILESAGLECRVSCRPLSGNRAWNGTNRV